MSHAAPRPPRAPFARNPSFLPHTPPIPRTLPAAAITLAILSGCASSQPPTTVVPPNHLAPIGALQSNSLLTTTLTEDDFKNAIEHPQPPLSP